MSERVFRILLADDDDALRRVLEFKLKKRGYVVKAVPDGMAAIDELRADEYDLLLADIRMPKLTGIELLIKARAARSGIKVILMTAYATVAQAVDAVKLGAYDYLTKPFDDEQLFHTLRKALTYHRLEEMNEELRKQLRQNAELDAIIGVSPAIRKLKEMIAKIAPTDATVLITGESGTGKELVARAIHGHSHREDARFVTVSCAAIPRELLESEMFGYVRGAFTGAVRDREGRFELADGGTLFLDEVAELPIELQAKLLRVIQERQFEPLGSEKTRAVDVRIVAATNVKLRERVVKAQFREDLYYRLNVIPLHVPPLRERKEDIPLLVQHFLKEVEPHRSLMVEDRLTQALMKYDWPGNVRELQSLVVRMIYLRGDDWLRMDDIPPDFTGGLPPPEEELPDGPLTFYEAEKRLVWDALMRTGWNRTKAAELLAIPRHVLIYRMKKYGIKKG